MKQKRNSLPKTILKILTILAIVTLVSAAAVNILMVAGTRPRIAAADVLTVRDADCILVLGAGVRSDGTPSHMLTDRLIVGVQLYEKGAAPKLLMSGDHGRPEYDEVNTMKAYAVAEGIPAGDVFMDHAGFSTYESLIRARDVFGVKKAVIVTQKYHLYRALWVAQALGIEAVGVPADLRTYIGQSMRDTREILARCKDFAAAVLKPAPTYGGEKIDIRGDGGVTDDKIRYGALVENAYGG